MTQFFDYPTLPRNHVTRTLETVDIPGSDKCPADYYAVVRGLLLRGGYRLADLQAEEGAHFKIELGYLRRINGATIAVNAGSGSRRQLQQPVIGVPADQGDPGNRIV